MEAFDRLQSESSYVALSPSVLLLVVSPLKHLWPPLQMGVAVQGGADAIIHKTRQILLYHPARHLTRIWHSSRLSFQIHLI
jgi:hypothetical protein